jgi:hypothetical protein
MSDRGKDSEIFEKVAGLLGKVEDFMEEKANEFQSGEIAAKIDAFKEKTGSQASKLIKKVKDTGLKIGDEVDEAIDSIKRKTDRTNSQDGAGI